MTNRRDFLKQSSLIAWGLSVPTFLGRTALAAKPARAVGAKDTILVVVQMTGGNDGLNTVIPFNDPEYAKLRPTIGIPATQVKKLNDQVGLHPSMDGLAGLLQDHALCVVQGVGYPNPSQSHFRSMDIWQAASTAENLTEGWIGKALKDVQHRRLSRGPRQRIGPAGPERLAESGAVDHLARGFPASRWPRPAAADQKNQAKIIEGAAKVPTSQPGLLDFVQNTALNTYASSQAARRKSARTTSQNRHTRKRRSPIDSSLPRN